MDLRIDHLEERIKRLDADILKYREEYKNTKNLAAQKRLKQKAINAIKQKKMLESQRDRLYGQQSVLDQTQFFAQTIQDTAIQVQALKNAKLAMESQLKGFNVESVEDLQDELEELFYTSNEIQDVLSRQYELPEGLDEDELEQEFLNLEDEMMDDEFQSLPSYLSKEKEQKSEDDMLKELEKELM